MEYCCELDREDAMETIQHLIIFGVMVDVAIIAKHFITMYKGS